jgi:ABC-type phosphate transport system auxiliary subunit
MYYCHRILPIFLLNITFQNFWVKDHRQIYLIGNPWVWMLSTLSVVAYVSVRGLLILRAKRGYRDFDNSESIEKRLKNTN